MGGRGKAGGVKLLDTANEVEEFTKSLIGKLQTELDWLKKKAGSLF